jgi:hypothetical protein
VEEVHEFYGPSFLDGFIVNSLGFIVKLKLHWENLGTFWELDQK